MRRLHSYFRSSAAYRVRIGLGLKGLDYETVPVKLRTGGHLDPAYRAVNPQGLVPAYEEDGRVLAQSLAILEYLDETHPEPPLLPADPLGRARVRRLALIVACEVHPLQNSGVRIALKEDFGMSGEDTLRWARHWVEKGFGALEALTGGDPATGRFCHGGAPTLADACLVPQMYNARRLGVDLTPYPTLVRVDAACLELDAFARAAPEAQPDAE